MDLLLKLANDQTKIVPAYGPVMTRAEFKAERDMMEEVRVRLFDHVREGEGPKDMLDAGALNGLPRTWKDPYKFLYDAAKGLWAHHDKLGPQCRLNVHSPSLSAARRSADLRAGSKGLSGRPDRSRETAKRRSRRFAPART